jgi:hypothetical protein
MLAAKVGSDRQRTIMQFREARLLEQTELFIVTLDAIPPDGRPAFLNTSRRFCLQAKMLPQMPAAEAVVPTSEFMKNLSAQLGADFLLVPLAASGAQCQAAMRRGHEGSPGMRGQCETLAVQLRDGSVVGLSVPPPRGFNPQRPGSFPFYLILFLISMGILVWIVSRMATRPLKQLAQAAEDLGGRYRPAAFAVTGRNGNSAGRHRLQCDAGAHPGPYTPARAHAGCHHA